MYNARAPGLEKRMGRQGRKSLAVDEVEVPHVDVGANCYRRKIERSADASQDCHILIHCPFIQRYANAWQETAR